MPICLSWPCHCAAISGAAAFPNCRPVLMAASDRFGPQERDEKTISVISLFTWRWTWRHAKRAEKRQVCSVRFVAIVSKTTIKGRRVLPLRKPQMRSHRLRLYQGRTLYRSDMHPRTEYPIYWLAQAMLLAQSEFPYLSS